MSQRNFQDRLFAQVLQAYLRVRCPCVLFVDTESWYLSESQETKKSHAILVIGYVTDETDPTRLSHLIVHDPGAGPFLIRSFRHCIDAARQYPNIKTDPSDPDKTERIPSDQINAVFVAPESVRLSAHEALSRILFFQQNSEKLFGRSRDQFLLKEVRLLRGKDIVNAYAATTWDSVSIIKNARAGQRSAEFAYFEKNIQKLRGHVNTFGLSQQLCWCVTASVDPAIKPTNNLPRRLSEEWLWTIPALPARDLQFADDKTHATERMARRLLLEPIINAFPIE
jgi:hypothetical protein